MSTRAKIGSTVRLAINFIFHLLAISHWETLDPIAREDSPRDDTKGIPPKVDEESLSVPEARPPVGVCYRHFKLSGQLVPRTRAASRLFRALKRECIGENGDCGRYEKYAWRTEKLVTFCAWVERTLRVGDGRFFLVCHARRSLRLSDVLSKASR